MKLEFSRRIFEKSSDTKFHENSSSGSRVILGGWANAILRTRLNFTAYQFMQMPFN